MLGMHSEGFMAANLHFIREQEQQNWSCVVFILLVVHLQGFCPLLFCVSFSRQWLCVGSLVYTELKEIQRMFRCHYCNGCRIGETSFYLLYAYLLCMRAQCPQRLYFSAVNFVVSFWSSEGSGPALVMQEQEEHFRVSANSFHQDHLN